MEKHGFAEDVRLFRTNIDNQIPYMGNFQYTPIYFYIRKNALNQITHIETITPAGRGSQFIDKVQDLTQLPLFKEQVRIKDPRMLYFASEKMMDLDHGYDCDFDLQEDNDLTKMQ